MAKRSGPIRGQDDKSVESSQAPRDEGTALVTVRSPDGGVFWERHPDHPNGEVWVAGNGRQPSAAVCVALTDAVKRALREGRLERVEEADGGERV